MKLSDVVGHAGLSVYTEIAMVLFIVAFVLVAIRVFRPGSRKEYDEASRLPLDERHETHGGSR